VTASRRGFISFAAGNRKFESVSLQRGVCKLSGHGGSRGHWPRYRVPGPQCDIVKRAASSELYGVIARFVQNRTLAVQPDDCIQWDSCPSPRGIGATGLRRKRPSDPASEPQEASSFHHPRSRNTPIALRLLPGRLRCGISDRGGRQHGRACR